MIDAAPVDRALRNILIKMFGENNVEPEYVVAWASSELGLDIQDVATILRIVSGEASACYGKSWDHGLK